jgi:hypothetical protein
MLIFSARGQQGVHMKKTLAKSKIYRSIRAAQMSTAVFISLVQCVNKCDFAAVHISREVSRRVASG